MSTAQEDFEINQIMRPWPTVTEVIEWVNTSGSYGSAVQDSDSSSMQWAVDAAITRISRMTQTDVYKRSTTAVTDPDTGKCSYPTLDPRELNEVPSDTWLATVMQAARWESRRLTPSGKVGSAEFESITNTSSLDPDILAMLGDQIVYGLA